MRNILVLLLICTSVWAVEYEVVVTQKDGTVLTVPFKDIERMTVQIEATAVNPAGFDKVKTALETFSLLQNHPNPFNPSTTITFNLPVAERVTVTIYDINGRQVRQLAQEPFQAGGHTLQWDGLKDDGIPAAAGMYFYQLRGNQNTQTRKMLLVK